jgi:hypothetical protein
MDNWDSLRNQIYSNMQLKTTEELALILQQDDHEEWSDTALEVVKQILIQRTGKLPELPISQDVSASSSDWDTINWQAISDECDRMVKKPGSHIIEAVVIALLMVFIGYSSYSSRSSQPQELSSFILFALISIGGLFGFAFWSYTRQRKAVRIVAKARVHLKHTLSINRGAAYHVNFSIQSAFTLSKNGKLRNNNIWTGHHTLTVLPQLHEELEEQDIVNLVFLSNRQVLGLLEEFVED